MMKIMTKYRKNAKFTKRENSRLTKNIFSGFLNWILGHLQSSDDENKIVIRELPILSDLDQQTIVGGPKFTLTNEKIFHFLHFFKLFLVQIIVFFSSNLMVCGIVLTKITLFCIFL